MASTAGTTASPSTGHPRRGVFLTLLAVLGLLISPSPRSGRGAD